MKLVRSPLLKNYQCFRGVEYDWHNRVLHIDSLYTSKFPSDQLDYEL